MTGIKKVLIDFELVFKVERVLESWYWKVFEYRKGLRGKKMLQIIFYVYIAVELTLWDFISFRKKIFVQLVNLRKLF